MDPLSGSDRLRGGPLYDFMASPNVGRAVADAPTLMSFSQQPNLGNFFNVLALAARVFADKTNPTRPDMSLGIMPGMPNPQGLPLTKVMQGGRPEDAASLLRWKASVTKRLSSPIQGEARRAYEDASQNADTELSKLGQPTRVYHGTSRAFDNFDPSTADTNALYGPGHYFTEDPKVAAGYAKKGLTPPIPAFEEEYAAKAAPNIRPAYLDITKPFDINAGVNTSEAMSMIDAAAAGRPQSKLSDWVQTGKNQDLYATIDKIKTGNATNDDLYRVLADMVGETRTRTLLQGAGYDGITHMGGANTGTNPHRVWISFKPEQIVNPFEYEAQFGVPRRQAVDAVSGQ